MFRRPQHAGHTINNALPYHLRLRQLRLRVTGHVSRFGGCCIGSVRIVENRTKIGETIILETEDLNHQHLMEVCIGFRRTEIWTVYSRMSEMQNQQHRRIWFENYDIKMRA